MATHTFLPLTPDYAAKLMSGFPHPWWIAGGWAIDLFVGKSTRPHADMDIAVLRGAEPALRAHFPSWDIQIAHDGAFEPWNGEILQAPRHQFFGRPSANAPWALEFLLEDHADDVWHFRRDPSVTLPVAELTRKTTDGIPYLRAEVAVLYKADTSGDAEKSGQDFATAVPLLDDAERVWLHDALALAHPDHPWVEALG